MSIISTPVTTPMTPGHAPPIAPHAGLPLRGGKRLLLLLVFGFLGLSVTVHAIALTYVFQVQHDLVRSDYYEAGERYDEELARRAVAGASRFVVARDAGSDVLVVSAPGLRVDAGAAARLRWFRPDAAAVDHVVELTAVGDGSVASWRASAPPLRTGAWTVRLEVDGATPLAIEVPMHVDVDGTVRARAAQSAARTPGEPAAAGVTP